MSNKGFPPMIDCRICKNRVLVPVWKMHVNGKKHLHYTPKKITVIGRLDVEDVDVVHEYFSQYGTIGTKKVTAEHGRVIIDYSFLDMRVHSKIIYKDHFLFNQKLKIVWEAVTAPPPQPFAPKTNQDKASGSVKQRLGPLKQKMKVETFSAKQAVVDSLKEAETFADQVWLLHSKLTVDRSETEKKKKLISEDLHSALAPMFALSKIYFFGSSVTGLDIHGSDLDIYIANVREDSYIKPEVSTLKLMRHLIFKSRKFCDILLIAQAKTPIIKCIHTKTQMCCDVNIKNKLAVCNSQLIRYYLSLDEKMRPLMVLIKFWADAYDFKKVNFFSSYALYMMVIFYLQQRGFLPSVKELQKTIAPDLVDGWNCAFELRGLTDHTIRDETITSLVAGFFRFYTDFDYFSQVISPYHGTAIDKTCFLEPVDLPDGFNLYLNHRLNLVPSSGICIQDPFELSRNVAPTVSHGCVGRLVTLCRTSLKLMENDDNELLHKILTQDAIAQYVFEIEKSDETDEDEWALAVKDVACKVLKEVLSMDVEPTKANQYCCTGGQSIWEDRIIAKKKLAQILPPNVSNFVREMVTTKYMVKYMKQTLSFGFIMTMNVIKKPFKVAFILQPAGKKQAFSRKIFLHASHFFASILNNHVTTEGTSGTETKLDIDSILAEAFSSVRAHSGDMTHQNDKISEETKISNTLPGKPVRGGSLDDQTRDDRTNGGETSKSVKHEQTVAKEEEEDVPADFFDDFSNQDFMDGLDIVDAWNEEKLLESSGDSSGGRDKQKRAHSPIRFSKSPARRRRSMRSRSKSLTKRFKRSNSQSQKRARSKSREKAKGANERRDPEKTKRDINRDKVKCAKDREQKIVNDKLRLVETGLVPPGMEMESDVKAIMRETRRSATASSSERQRDTKTDRDRSDRDRDRLDRDRLERERRLHRRSTSRELLHKPLRRSPTPPLYRPRPRDLVYRPRKRAPSIESNLSDRELWIRNRKRSRSRSRSRDAMRRAKAKKLDEEKKKKKSFLEEIRDKLNETRPMQSVVPTPAPYNMPYPSSVPHPIPAPVPAPGQFFPGPTPPIQQQYDQSFFIGDGFSQNAMRMPQPVGFGMTGNPGNVLHVQMPVVPVRAPMQNAVVPVAAPRPPPAMPKPQAMVSPKINLFADLMPRARVQEKKQEPAREPIEDISQLFADKKISLSDFLTITAKCEVQKSSPEHLQKKIKVISRCQDAIKAMSEDSKFNGRLCVKASSEGKSKWDVQYQSPLRRIPLVRFQFTTPAKVSEESDSFSLALDKILQKIGLLKETIDLDEPPEPPSRSRLSYSSSFADEEAAAPTTTKVAFLNAKKTEAKSECEECKRRKAKAYAEVGSQCANDNETASVATQVTEEDLNPTKGLPKNDSIAYLTPAQLLGKGKEPPAKGKEEEEKPKKSAPQEKKAEPPPPRATPPARRGGKPPKPAPFRGRGGRRPQRGRPNFNSHADYGYEGEADFYEYEEPREDFATRRFGGPSRPPRYQTQYMEEDVSHQYMDDEANFADFSHPYRGGRGRGGRFASRY